MTNHVDTAQALTAPASHTRIARKETARGEHSRKRLAGAGTAIFSLMHGMGHGLAGDCPLSLETANSPAIATGE